MAFQSVLAAELVRDILGTQVIVSGSVTTIDLLGRHFTQPREKHVVHEGVGRCLGQDPPQQAGDQRKYGSSRNSPPQPVSA
ncbi:hypothetical protein [Deinococcus sonorensis]|uniref:Uncharacterized protein n=2 Tax=Deinococcus sonorensis TaxID=309891 RepID=A0AAU7UGQ5_9DEIO